MANSEKKYVNGGGKEITFNDGGSLINVYVDLTNASEQGAIRESKSGKKFLSFTLAKRREESEYGDTHYLYIKELGGGGAAKTKTAGAKPKVSLDEDKGDNLPF